FRSFYFPSFITSTFGKGSLVRGIGFLNLPVIKYFCRFFSLLCVLLKEMSREDRIFLIYCVHLPFIAAVVLAKRIKFRSSRICLVVPDLPEFMSDQGGFF